jgi:purine-binding chemotaxis protein CheW
MTGEIREQNRVLVVGVKERFCALPLGHVVETMRPLPVERLNGMPPFVTGVAIIRGFPTPVVDLGALLGASSESVQRFVTVRTGEKQVALSVEAVLGVRDLGGAAALQDLPPLLRNASQELVAMIGTLDEKLLFLLREGWELPEEVWQGLVLEEKAL